MKKLINRPEDVVSEMIAGLAALHPGLRKLPGQNVLIRADANEVRAQRVALISGGGSGHEPAHAGYVGQGMLSAAVAGEVFTSPSPDSILAAIRAVGGPKGVLLIVKNYTGDRLNFGLAAELARGEGIPVELVIVADDVALAASTENAGRRGLAGTVFVHKVAGAAAEAGGSLAEVAVEARAAAGSVWTMGVALSPCIVPAAGQPSFNLGESEIELGLGIHGEPGVERRSIEPADPLVDRMIGAILNDADLKPGDRVALMVNNLGGSTLMELAIVARRAIHDLEGRSLVVERTMAGSFLTALEMAGVSLSVLKLDDSRLARLDAATAAPAWPNAGPRSRDLGRIVVEAPASVDDSMPGPPRSALGRRLERAIRDVADALIAEAPRLNDLDRAVGDGDLGTSLSRGAEALIGALSTYPLDDPSATLAALGGTLQRALGGTSGPLYAILLHRAASRLRAGATDDPRTWAAAFRAGVEAVGELGGARAGDRTMLEALAPAANALDAALNAGRSPSEALTAATEAAAQGAAATAGMFPRRGRSSYLGQRAIGHPDPGAIAVAVWLGALGRVVRCRRGTQESGGFVGSLTTQEDQ